MHPGVLIRTVPGSEDLSRTKHRAPQTARRPTFVFQHNFFISSHSRENIPCALRCTAGDSRRHPHHSQDPHERVHAFQRLDQPDRRQDQIAEPTPVNMPDPDLPHWLVGLATAVVVVLLTVPALLHACRITRLRLGAGYVQLGQDDNYEDRDGIATEASIRALSDTRPRIALWLSTVLGLGSSVAARVLVLNAGEHTRVLAELAAWAEPACWVSRLWSCCASATHGRPSNLSVHRSPCLSSVLFFLPSAGTNSSSGSLSLACCRPSWLLSLSLFAMAMKPSPPSSAQRETRQHWHWGCSIYLS